jgi:predicted  nucleic acid-binding Zn-ribbon protein
MNSNTSEALNNAETRLIALKMIDPVMDFGNDRSIASLTEATEELRAKLAQYNEMRTAIDTLKAEFRALEKKVNRLSSDMLRGVEFQYGQDSIQYKQAGGTPTSERIRKSRATRLRTAAAKQKPA